MSIINVHDEPIHLKKGTAIGRLVPVAAVTELKAEKLQILQEGSTKYLTEESIPEQIRCILGEVSELMFEQKSSAYDFIAVVQDGKVPMSIINVHDEPIHLKKGTAIGRLIPVVAVTELKAEKLQILQEGSTKYLTEESIPEQIRCILGEVSELMFEQKSSAYDFILDYPQGFITPGGRKGRTDWTEHGMDMQGNPLLKQMAHRLSWAKQDIADRELEKMLEDDVIEPSTSPWSSPIVLVTEKDGSVRFCVDYRNVNELCRKDAYPLPRIDDTLETLGGAHWFCTMDLASGYWQIKMKDSDKPKTVVVTCKGLFQFKVMPFVLSNAPATFQRLMDRVLAGLHWEQCLVYLDDIIFFGRTFEEMLARLKCVMDKLQAAGLKLKASKCKWFQKSVQYLGHIVSSKGIECDPEKIATIKDWPTPRTVTQVRSFLGLAPYYRKFIENFYEIVYILINLTRKQATFR